MASRKKSAEWSPSHWNTPQKQTAADKKFDAQVKKDLSGLTDTQKKRYHKVYEGGKNIVDLSGRKNRHSEAMDAARQVK